MDTITIAVGYAECGESPVLPYIGERANGKYFTRLCALYLQAALLRCDFDVMDIPHAVDDVRDMIMRINRHTADGAVLVSLGAFGSRKSFNDVCGGVVKYANNRGNASRIFCEDICAFVSTYRKCVTAECDPVWQAVGCPAAIVDAGYLTNFDEAKLSLDPDYAIDIAEHIAMGACEYYGYPYVRRDDITAYPILCAAATGKRGRKIKMLQALLSANGMPVTIDGIYGKETDAAVRAFEKNNKLSGGANAAMWRELLLLNPRPIEYNDAHCTVLYIQRKLHAKLYDAPRDGVLGDATLSALNEFAKDIESEYACSKSLGINNELIKKLSRTGGGRPRLF